MAVRCLRPDEHAPGILLAAIAAAGVLPAGVAVPGVYAVGAGHVALDRIGRSGGRGRGPALAALGTGDAIAALALFSILPYPPAAVRQLAG